MDTKPKPIQWQIFGDPSSTIDNQFRCIQTRLGSFMSGQVHRKAIVSTAEKSSYKRYEDNGSQIGHYDIYNGREGRYFSTFLDVQHGCPIGFVENGCNKERTVGHYRRSRITITAEYIPSAMNIEADRESRQTRGFSMWKV